MEKVTVQSNKKVFLVDPNLFLGLYSFACQRALFR